MLARLLLLAALFVSQHFGLRFTADSGTSIDPSGGPVCRAGSAMDPNGNLTVDDGRGIDPNG